MSCITFPPSDYNQSHIPVFGQNFPPSLHGPVQQFIMTRSHGQAESALKGLSQPLLSLSLVVLLLRDLLHLLQLPAHSHHHSHLQLGSLIGGTFIIYYTNMR